MASSCPERILGCARVAGRGEQERRMTKKEGDWRGDAEEECRKVKRDGNHELLRVNEITRHVDPPIHSWLWGFRHFRAACLVGYSEQMEYFPTGIVFLSGPSVGISHWEACNLTRHHIARDNL
ncbi:hypothetical protein B0H13DRAFT_1904055 [Mycena leptocephala]|nr:hypothetical protein B0H13DRAFT_1904055 [Mycena leptocephala]